MNTIRFARSLLNACATQRPPGYLNELMQAKVAEDELHVTLDRDHPAYAALEVRHGQRYDMGAIGFPQLAAKTTEEQRRAAADRGAEVLARRGRALWGELHAKALAADDIPAFVAWLKWDFYRRIPCGECKQHWQTIIVGVLPPVFLACEEIFPWSVAAHNEVNKLRGVPEMTVDEARRLHATTL